MNIAILIGVSEYKNVSDLSGCANDIQYLNRVLKCTGKFQNIYKFENEVSSSSLKQKLVQIIEKHESDQIEEIFFYFTGHGSFLNNEFYYILSDFDRKSINLTSLQNIELDNFLKNLNPKVLVKVIDACQSGTFYVKESGSIDQYFNNTSKQFECCYFMYSCLNSQSSFQTSFISDFTYSFIESLSRIKENHIRYKNIIDFISDKFRDNPLQNPLFVVQAKYTEKFCSNLDSFKNEIVNIQVEIKNSTPERELKLSLKELIINDSINYSTKEETLEVLNKILERCSNFSLSEEIKDLFKIKLVVIENGEHIANEGIIAEHIHNSEIEFYATSRYETKLRDNSLSNIGYSGSALLGTWNLGTIGGDIQPLTYIYKGFDHNFVVPFKALSIDLKKEFQNIEDYNCTITYLVNHTQIQILYFFDKYKTINWDKSKHSFEFEWIQDGCSIKETEKLDFIIGNILENFNAFVTMDLKKVFGLAIEEEE